VRTRLRLHGAAILAILAALALMTGCAALTFGVANLPSRFGPETVRPALAYGADPRQRVIVVLPPPSFTAPRAMVVFFHGGRWSSGRPDDYRFVGEALAQHGIVTVLAGYRLYPAVRFPAFVEDAAAAVAWSREHATDYCADPSALFVMGHSAGAHIAAHLALDPRWLSAAGAPGSLRGAIGLSGPYDVRPSGDALLEAIFAGTEPVDAVKPLTYARADAPPLLLIQGRADPVVHPRNAVVMAAAQQSRGAVAELLLYDDLDHGDTVAAFSGLRRIAPLADAVASFVARQRGASVGNALTSCRESGSTPPPPG
jgi:acetyl esterase/lipase